jgi:hypothetical protein
MQYVSTGPIHGLRADTMYEAPARPGINCTPETRLMMMLARASPSCRRNVLSEMK